VKKAAAKRAVAPPRRHRARRPTENMVDDMAEHLPAVVRLEDVAGTPTVRIIEELGLIVADLKAVVAYAKDPSGKVRNANGEVLARRACGGAAHCTNFEQLRIRRPRFVGDGFRHGTVLNQIRSLSRISFPARVLYVITKSLLHIGRWCDIGWFALSLKG
jgi:hypothetical protein